MNVSVSTIADMFGQTTGHLSALPRPDASERRTQSPAAPKETQAPADTAPKTTAPRDSAEIRKEPTSQGREDFSEVIRKKTKSQETQEAPNSGKPTEQNAESNAVDQRTWLAQQSVAAQHTNKEATGKIKLDAEKSQPGEGGASAELNLLATETKTQSGLKAAIHTQPEKKDNTASIPTPNSTVSGGKAVESQPVKTASSAEPNLLATATKTQPGLEVAIHTQPEKKDNTGSIPTPNSSIPLAKVVKSQPVDTAASAEPNLLATEMKTQPGLKAAIDTQPEKSDDTGTVPKPKNTAPDAKAVTKVTNAKEPMPEVPFESAARNTNADNKPAIVETPATAKTPAPASNTKDLVGEAFVDGNAKTAHTGEKAAMTADMPATAQVKPSQTQVQVVTADRQESGPTAGTAADLAAPETPSKAPGATGGSPAHKSPQASNGSEGRHLNAAAVQAATGQTEAGENSNSNANLNLGSEQTLSETTPATEIAQLSTTFTVNAKAASPPEQSLPGEPSQSVGDQILDSVRSSLSQQTGNRQITIQLHPPELGKVSVKIQEQDAQITGTLEVSKAQTRAEIEQALPQIIRNLADSGVQVRRFEVVLSQGEQSQQQGFKDPSLQDSAFGQHNSANSDSSGDEQQETATHYGPTGRGSYQSAAALQEMVVRDDSIDILV